MPAKKDPNAERMKGEELFEFNKAMYGNAIRSYRIKRSLNQPQLAQMIGVKKNAVSNWEAGRARPDINLILPLCKALDISASCLFGESGARDDLSSEERRLLSNYNVLSSAGRETINVLMDKLVDLEDKRLRSYCERGFTTVFRNDSKAAAGIGNPLSDHRHGHNVYVRTSREACLADEIIVVTGDSMEPTYYDGDELFVEYSEQLEAGEIGIFVADGDGFVKEYQPDGLHSHNPAYQVLKFGDDDHVRCVGRVIGVVTSDQYATKEELIMLEDIRQERIAKRNAEKHVRCLPGATGLFNDPLEGLGMDSTRSSMRVYVKVNVDFAPNGGMIPRSLVWEDGVKYTIDKVKDVRPAHAPKAGGQGDRYTVIVSGEERYLYFEHSTRATPHNRVSRTFIT